LPTVVNYKDYIGAMQAAGIV